MTARITAVLACFNEESTITQFVPRLVAALQASGRAFGIVAVNDGSADDTFGALRRLYDAIPEFDAVVDLHRNFGQPAALACGIAHAGGDALLFMDTDLQMAPEQVSELIAAFDAGADFVTGKRVRRRDPFWRLMQSVVGNWVLRKLIRIPVSDIGCTFKLIDRRVVSACGFGERKELNFVEMFRFARRVKEVDVRHSPRAAGRSGWSFRALRRFFLRMLLRSGAGGLERLSLYLIAIGFAGIVLGASLGSSLGWSAASIALLLWCGLISAQMEDLATMARKEAAYLVRDTVRRR